LTFSGEKWEQVATPKCSRSKGTMRRQGGVELTASGFATGQALVTSPGSTSHQLYWEQGLLLNFSKGQFSLL